jgi:hypothetical protein
MTVPTEASFNECIGLLASCNAEELRREFWSAFLGDTDVDRRALIRRALSLIDERNRSVVQHDVVKWLTTQQIFCFVVRKLFPRDRYTGLSEAIEDVIEHNIEAYCESLSNVPWENGRRDLITFDTILTACLCPSTGYVYWLHQVILALKEYHYVESAAAMTGARKTLTDNIRTALEGVRAIKRIMGDENAMTAIRKLPRRRQLMEWSDYLMDRNLRGLEALAELDPSVIYPISRNDETAAERLFVYRIADVHQWHFRSDKVDTIADLMTMEGFRGRLGVRTIEKLCQKFRESNRTLTGEFR